MVAEIKALKRLGSGEEAGRRKCNLLCWQEAEGRRASMEDWGILGINWE